MVNTRPTKLSLGAFLEISAQARNVENLKRWVSEGKKHLEFNDKISKLQNNPDSDFFQHSPSTK